MIYIFGRWFFRIVRTLLPGPKDANRPLLIYVEDSDETTNEIPMA